MKTNEVMFVWLLGKHSVTKPWGQYRLTHTVHALNWNMSVTDL